MKMIRSIMMLLIMGIEYINEDVDGNEVDNDKGVEYDGDVC